VGFQRSVVVDARRDSVWEALEAVKHASEWSRWVERIGLDTEGLREGSHVDVVIRTPLALSLHVDILLERCSPADTIEARVEGDLQGVAYLRIAPESPGTRADLWWYLEVKHPGMRAMAATSGPFLRWGHQMIASASMDAFARRVEAMSHTASHPPPDSATGG
jgi:hypothetical protein